MAVQPNQQLNLDVSQQIDFVTFFKCLPKKAATTVRLWDRGDFYTAHGSDAVLASQLVLNSAKTIRMIGKLGNQIESLVLSRTTFETLVKELLLVRQYRVEVYCNSSRDKAASKWVVEYKGSPGNLSQFEDMLWTTSSGGADGSDLSAGSVSMAVCLFDGRRSVAVALVDPAERHLKVVHFADDEQLAALEGLVTQMAPRECLVPEAGHDEVKKVLERAGVLVTPRKKADWSADGIEQDLNRLLDFKDGQQRNSRALPQMDLTTAVAALAALIKYLELLADTSNESQYSLSTLELNLFVRLDAAAVRALNLLPAPRATTQQPCLLTLLDKCRTPQGHRLLSRWLLQPLTDLNAIRERHDVVEVLQEEGELRQELTDEHLRRFPDLVSLGNKMARSKITLQDCFKVYQAVERLPSLLASLSRAKRCAAVNAMFLAPLEELAQDLAPYKQMVETILDLELVTRGEFLVKADFDENLKELRGEMDSVEARLKKQVGNAASDLGMEAHKSLKLESNAQYGYFYRVTLKDEKNLRNNKRYRILDTTKSGIRFRDDRLAELNDKYLSMKESYASHQSTIVAEIIGIASGYNSVVRRLGNVVAQLDVLTAFAVVAACAPTSYVRPVMRAAECGVLDLKQVRHPCVEILDGISYIANDVSLKQGETTQYVVTGPNMGGKSTFIRSVGVVVLMAQVGSFVPCAAAEVALVDAILARVGADDSQLKGMSTFMNEMVETAAMIRTATQRSLVIVDELGRGTSTYDGCGIAWAIAEHLAFELKPFTLFATHFHELSALADRGPAVANRHMTAVADAAGLTLLYSVKPGFCDQSYGLHVARMARFPDAVLRHAAAKQAQLEAQQAHCNNTQVLQEGEEIIKAFLAKCKQLVTDGVSEGDVSQRVKQFKESVRAPNNSYVESLIA